MRAFKLLEKDDVFAWEVEGGRKEVVLVTFFLVVLLIESTLVLFEVFVELILATQLLPSPEMVDLHMRQHPVPLENPVYLLLLAPYQVPVIIPCLLPLAVAQRIVDAVLKSCFEFDVGANCQAQYGALG